MSSVLLCSSPVHGHVAPLLSVASHLVAADHRVRFLTGARCRGAVERTGAEFLPLPAAADFDDTALDREFPSRTDHKGLDQLRYDLREVFLRPMPDQLAAVDAALTAEPTDAVLAAPRSSPADQQVSAASLVGTVRGAKGVCGG